MRIERSGQLSILDEIPAVEVAPAERPPVERDPESYRRHVAAAMYREAAVVPLFPPDKLPPVRWLPIVFDRDGVCTQHQLGCPRLLCPRNLTLEFGEPFTDTDGNRFAEVTENDGVHDGRLGRRPSWTPLDQAARSAEMDASIVELVVSNVENGVEVCASMIARIVRQVAEEIDALDLSPGERQDRRRRFEELTLAQLAAKLGVSDETLRLTINRGMAKIRAAAEEGGYRDGDEIYEIIEAALYGAGVA